MEEYRSAQASDLGFHPAIGRWPCRYRLMTDPLLARELEAMSNARSYPLSSGGSVQCVSFQPCAVPALRNQDRCCVEEWTLRGEIWRFTAVFDGHSGHEAVDYAVKNLPKSIRQELERALAGSPTAQEVTLLLENTILAFDQSLGLAVCDLFPRGFRGLSGGDIRGILEQNLEGETNLTKLRRAMSGTTATIVLIDPTGQNVWTAGVGDSIAGCATRLPSGEWEILDLTSAHSAETNDMEIERVRRDHPAESTSIMDGRVLGILSVTRALGDWDFKLPSSYAVWLSQHYNPDSHRLGKLIKRNLTPPYISGRPEVLHVKMPRLDNTQIRFILMASDGILDIHSGQDQATLWTKWIESVGRDWNDSESNAAVRILRDGLGGQDNQRVSIRLSLEQDFRWVDDTTIIVQPLMP